MSIVDKLRVSRKNPSVLKLRALKIRGEDPEILIFFHEGPDDVPVYEEWMSRIANCPRYEPVPGGGKQQLLSYHQQLKESADPLLEKMFFFVDRDFDHPISEDKHLFELDCYSIENLICTKEVLESLLKDDFRRSGNINERARIKEKFLELLSNFYTYFEPINFLLFTAQRTGSRVVKKPKNVTDVVNISVDSISQNYINLSALIEIESPPNNKNSKELLLEFHALPEALRQRGKYLLDMYRQWLRALTKDLKSPNPILFDSQDERLPGDPSSVSLRRLASGSSVPIRLEHYVVRCVIGEK